MSDNNATQTLPDPPTTLLRYAEAVRTLDRHPLRTRDTPAEYELSLAVPTARWTRRAYAVFAGAAVRHPGLPKQLAVPDRWWAIDVHSGALLAFALTAAVPFTDRPLTGPAVVPRVDRPVRMVADDHAMLGRLMDQVAPAFFDRERDLPAGARVDLGHLWRSLIPESTAQWYRALAPDFFAWLETPEAQR